MYITKTELKNFRNYENLSLDFHRKVNLILGKNAQGKTNLLESIYVVSIGRSFRTNKDSDLIKFGSDFARVYTESIRDGENIKERKVHHYENEETDFITVGSGNDLYIGCMRRQ